MLGEWLTPLTSWLGLSLIEVLLIVIILIKLLKD